MADQRVLAFPEPAERADLGRNIVVFTGKDGNKEVLCAISGEALDDYFDGDNKDPVKVLRANRERIEHLARRKYLANQLEADGSVLVKTADI